MNIKHHEIIIEPENPFANCKLDRQKYSNVLTNIITLYSNGFVLAINNKWGTGKTTFVKMWEQDLKNNDFQTLYFNAWENDYEDNPLIALMGELKTLTTEATEPEFKKTLKRASIIVKRIAPIVVKAIADKYIETESVKDAIVGITEGLSDVFENEVNEYEKKKKSVSDFRQSLSEFIVNTNKEKPLIFIIDELDRCRPNYAVSILEQVKHFFSVPNIVFVLSIDKEQLGNAIKGVYGSDKIDAEEYLRRFIDLEYSIPEPDSGVFYKYLYEYFKFDDFFHSAERLQYGGLGSESYSFQQTCKLIFTDANIPLRQQEKIFIHSRLALRSFNFNNYVVPSIFLYLNFIKISHSKFYELIKNKSLSIKEFQEHFLLTIKSNINKNTEREIMGLEIYLVNAYNKYFQDRHSQQELIIKDEESKKNISLISSIIKENSEEEVLELLQNLNRGFSERNPDLSYFIKHIELLEDLKR